MIDLDVIKGLVGYSVRAISNNPDAIINTLPIKAPGRTFEPPNNQRYFEIFPIQNRQASVTWGDEKYFKGMLRIILHVAIDDTGIYSPIVIQEKLALQFAKGSWIYEGVAKLLITDHAFISDEIIAGQSRLFPLTVPYQCFHVPS